MLLSIIIITYNRSKELIELVKNLLNQKYKNIEIIIVDNNSSDDTSEKIQAFNTVKYYYSEKNLGVPGGRNYGIKKASGDILFFIDNDAEVIDGALELIVHAFKTNEELGILAPRIDNYFSKELDRSSWVYSVHKLKDKDRSFYTFYFVGCAFAVKKEVFDQCGLLWDDLFFMHEEKDFAHRVIDAGFSIKYDPGIRVYHKVSTENRYNISSRFFEYGTRNTIWIYLRYYPLYIAFYKTFIFLFFQSIEALKSGNFKIHLISIWDAFKNIHTALQKRQKINYATRQKIKKLKFVKKDAFFKRIQRIIGNVPYTEE